MHLKYVDNRHTVKWVKGETINSINLGIKKIITVHIYHITYFIWLCFLFRDNIRETIY